MTRPRSYTARGLLGNSIALLAMTHITTLLGYVFWMVCARHVSASVVGTTSTVIGAMTLVAILAVAGFVPLLTRVLPGASAEERSGLCSTALVVAVVVSGVGGAAGALLLPNNLQTAVGTGWLVALLAVGAVCTAAQLLINAALLGVRRAELSLLGSVVGSVSRLLTVGAILALAMVAVGTDTTAARMILVVWVASLLLNFGLSVMLLARATPDFRFRPGRIWFSRLRRSVAWDHVATLAVRAPFYVVPILASAIFPTAQVGYLSMAGMISAAFFAVAAAVSNALLADCADRPERLRAQARRALQLIGVLLVPPVAIGCLFAPKLLGFFGADYAQASGLLVLLLLATLPDALINVMVAGLRVQRRLISVAAVTVTGAVIGIGGSWLLMPHLGIAGAGWAGLVGQMTVVTTLAVLVLRRSSSQARSVDCSREQVARASDAAPVALAGTAATRSRRVRSGRA